MGIMDINTPAKYTGFPVLRIPISSKTYTLDIEKRLELVRASVSHIENVEAICSEGMLIDLCDELEVTAIVKGIRNATDLEYEMIHARWNKAHNDRAETLFLPADESFNSVSSTEVRKIIEQREFENLRGIISENALEYIKRANNC